MDKPIRELSIDDLDHVSGGLRNTTSFVPPLNPATPPGIPIPYPNTIP